MSLYNMMMGVNATGVVMASLILNQRVDKMFPRFRDVFTKDEECPLQADQFDVLIYTRMGGGNSECWTVDGGDITYKNTKGICECPACKTKALEKEPCVIGRYNDSFDSTYCTFIIKFTDEQTKASPDEKRKRLERMFPEIAKDMEKQEKIDNTSRKDT